MSQSINHFISPGKSLPQLIQKLAKLDLRLKQAGHCGLTPSKPASAIEMFTLLITCPKFSGRLSSDQLNFSRFSPSSDMSTLKEPCKYGAACYRRNPEHFDQFTHPPQVLSRLGDTDRQLA